MTDNIDLGTFVRCLNAARAAWPTDSRNVADMHPADQALFHTDGWRSFSEREAALREQRIARVVRAVILAMEDE